MTTSSKIMQLLGALLFSHLPLLVQAQAPGSPSTAPSTPSVSAVKIPIQQTLPPETDIKRPSAMSKTSVTPERALDILDFWFGILPSPDFFPEEKMSIWFAGTPDVDRQIRENFTQDVLNAVRGDYNNWRETPKGRLALILLLDQFPRHIYRNKPQAFMSDRMARGLVLEGVQRGDNQHLYPVEQAFFYLPLEHAEDPAMQDLSVTFYRQLLAGAPAELKPQMDSFFQYALLHHQQIARFGRFPYRNTIVGRQSTPEEVVFLNQWGKSSF